jgi:hypothetical protein
MLFGFRGHWNGVIDTTANGEVSVGLIQMRVSIASPDIFSGVVDIVPFYYEADVNSGGTPLNISLNGTFVSAATTTNRSGFIREGTYSLPTDGYGAATLSGSRTFGSQYVEPISPLTRRNRFNISRPDLIEAIDITTLSNNGGKSNTSNQQRNINFDDYSRFTNLKYISFNEGYISGMTGNLPNSLEYLRIGEQPVLRNIPKINNGLKHFILNETAIPTSAITYTLSGVSTLETLNFINFSPYPSVNANIQQLSNNLDLITNTSLKNLYIINKSSGDIFLHNNHNQWVDFYVRNSMYTNIGYINSLFTGSTVRDLFIDGNGLSWNRNIDSDDINNNMRYCYLYSTNISGNCIITDNKPNLIDFRLGNNTLRSGVQLNSHPIVNISGLTACETIDLSGCNVEELELPVNTVCTSLILLDNRLDIGINPNLVAKINAMTALVTLQLSNSTNFSGGAATGQNSTNGLGANPDLSSLVNATTIFIGSCKITGILTLPNVNKLTQLTVSENTGLTSIANIAPHVSLLLFRAINCPALVIANLATFPVATTFQAGKCTFTLSDYSTRTSATEINLDLRECVFSSGDFISFCCWKVSNTEQWKSINNRFAHINRFDEF